MGLTIARSLSSSDGPNYRSGAIYHISNPSTQSTAALGPNVMRFTPWLVKRRVNVASFFYDVTVASTDVGATVRTFLYADDGYGRPGKQVIVAAADGVADAIAVVENALPNSLALLPGLYWVGLTVKNAPLSNPTLRIVNQAQIEAIQMCPPVISGSGLSSGNTFNGVTLNVADPNALPTDVTGSAFASGVSLPRFHFRVA